METREMEKVVQRAILWGMLNNLNGKSFCFTGTASIPRAQLSALIQDLDGIVDTAVGNNTDYLIVPNGSSPSSSKFRSALAKGVLVITEEEFCGMILPTTTELLKPWDEMGVSYDGPTS